jgi:hypothetical protein
VAKYSYLKKRIRFALPILVALLALGFAATLLWKPSPPLCPSIQHGLAFLKDRYNPSLGLLNESPHVAPNTYWLTNDNALAAYALAQLGQTDLSAALDASLQSFGFPTNGLVEVIWGLPISFPPYVSRKVMISQAGPNQVWQEFHDQGSRFEDWAEYSDLSLLGALNSHVQGRLDASLSTYSRALAQFDGIGFHDKAFDGKYSTYKLALALYVGATIHAPIPNGDRLLQILQAMQSANGGFVTHYRDSSRPEGDANTETTTYALLAQHVYGCAPH